MTAIIANNPTMQRPQNRGEKYHLVDSSEFKYIFYYVFQYLQLCFIFKNYNIMNENIFSKDLFDFPE